MYEATSSPVDVHMNLVKDLSRHISSFLTLYLAVWHFEVSRGLHVNERRSSIMWPLLGRAVIYSCWGKKTKKKKTAWLNVTAYITAGDVSAERPAVGLHVCTVLLFKATLPNFIFYVFAMWNANRSSSDRWCQTARQESHAASSAFQRVCGGGWGGWTGENM